MVRHARYITLLPSLSTSMRMLLQDNYGKGGFDTTNFEQMQSELDSFTEEEFSEMCVVLCRVDLRSSAPADACYAASKASRASDSTPHHWAPADSLAHAGTTVNTLGPYLLSLIHI